MSNLRMAPTGNRGPVSDGETDSLGQHAFSWERSEGGRIIWGRNKEGVRPTEEKGEKRETCISCRTGRYNGMRSAVGGNPGCSLAREPPWMQVPFTGVGNSTVWKERFVMAGHGGNLVCKALEAGIAHVLREARRITRANQTEETNKAGSIEAITCSKFDLLDRHSVSTTVCQILHSGLKI